MITEVLEVFRSWTAGTTKIYPITEIDAGAAGWELLGCLW